MSRSIGWKAIVASVKFNDYDYSIIPAKPDRLLALKANHAVIAVIEMLSRSPQTEQLLALMRVGHISEA